MKIDNIEFPTALYKVEDLEHENLDVFIGLEDGFTYTAVVSTPKNYLWYIEKENKNHYCGLPDIIVKELTEEIITEAINECARDEAYLLKCYYLSGILSIDILNQFMETHQNQREEIY